MKNSLSLFIRTTVAAFAAAVLLFSAGCGDASRTAAPSVSETGATRTISDALGNDVTIPVRPERVLALSEADLDAMLALGVTPAGACAGRGQASFPRYLGEETAGMTLLGALYRPSVDRILQVDPDLILAGGWLDAGLEEQLRRIAPVVRTHATGDGWRDALRGVASALDREAEAKAFLSRYDGRLEAVRAAVGAPGELEASVVRWNPKGPAFMYADSFSRGVLNDIGFRVPEAQQVPGPAHSPVLSFESLDQIDADWLFLGTLSGEGEAAKTLEHALSHPAFARLRAATEGRVVRVDGSVWTSAGGPLAALKILEDVEEAARNGE